MHAHMHGNRVSIASVYRWLAASNLHDQNIFTLLNSPREFQAFHLALPIKSNAPGFSALHLPVEP